MNDQLLSRLRVLEDLSRQVRYIHGDECSSFHSQTTQQRYYIESTDPVLVRPILRMRKVYLVQTLINMYVPDVNYRKEFLLDRLSTAKTVTPSATGTPDEPTLKIYLAQVYADDVEEVESWLVESGNYEDLLKKHKGIKEVFIDNIYSGTTDTPSESARDFIKLGLYKNKETDELVLVTNYILHKKYQNKNGMLDVGSRPKDSNFLILLGLLPAFIPAFKERLTADELAFFKLLITPVKVYHERNSAILYKQIISTEDYNNIIKNQRVEKLRKQFRLQEERIFSRNISDKTRAVDDLSKLLQQAEEQLLTAQQEMAYYTAGDSKLEDTVSYLFDHAYLQDLEYSGSNLALKFRVPLSQWDSEMADTILRGIKTSPIRYNLEEQHIKDIQKFIQYILIEQIAKYWVLAAFNIDMNTFQYRITKIYWDESGDTFRPEKYLTYNAGVNPHMEYYSCVGSYRVQIDKASQRKDLPGLVESLLAPYKNWNLSDGVVQNKMFKYALPGLIDNNVPCIEYNGEMLDIHTFFNKVELDRTPPVVEEPIKKKRTSRQKKVTTEDLEEALRAQATVEEAETNDN